MKDNPTERFKVVCLDSRTYEGPVFSKWGSRIDERMVTDPPGKVCGAYATRETAEKHAKKNRKMFKLRYEVRDDG